MPSLSKQRSSDARERVIVFDLREIFRLHECFVARLEVVRHLESRRILEKIDDLIVALGFGLWLQQLSRLPLACAECKSLSNPEILD